VSHSRSTDDVRSSRGPRRALMHGDVPSYCTAPGAGCIRCVCLSPV